MSDVVNTVKDYFNFLIGLDFIAGLYIFSVLFVFAMLLVWDFTGFSGKISRGSRRTIKFFREKGWVDNSNISSFLMKCMRHFPYVLRANFSLFTNSEGKPLTDYVNDRCYVKRDHEVREKTVKYLYDFVMTTGAILSFLHIMITEGFLTATKYLIVVLCFIILRFVLMGTVMVREIIGKKSYFKALDLMANGIFLSNKRNAVKEIGDVYITETEDGIGKICEGEKAIEEIAVEKTH